MFTGCVTLWPAADRQWLEYFHLAPESQGRGLGSAVLGALLERTNAEGGFTVESEDPVDVFTVRAPVTA